MIRRHRLVIIGAVEPGGAVERSAGALHEFKMFVGAHMLGSLKKHVFKQVREPGTPLPFVGRPDMVPEVHGHDRRRVILGEGHEQSVWQAVGLYRNAHCVSYYQSRTSATGALIDSANRKLQ